MKDSSNNIIDKTFKAFTVSINSDIQSTLNSHFTRDTINDLRAPGEMVYTWSVEKHSSIFATFYRITLPGEISGTNYNSLYQGDLTSVDGGSLIFAYNSGTFPLELNSDEITYQPISSFQLGIMLG